MKSLILAGFLAAAFAPIANAQATDDCKRGHTDGHCVDADYFKCYARDSRGNMWESDSVGIYNTSIVQYRVIRLCRAESSRPATCKPLGCQNY